MRIWIPAKFYIDHDERALPTPADIERKGNRFLIDTDDPAFGELMDDARFYAHPNGPDEAPQIVAAAKRLIAAVNRQTPPPAPRHLAARRCHRCGKTKGVTFHALQLADGRMQSIAAHLACFKLIRRDAIAPPRR